jgi:N-acetylglucosamine kinase-like BadF-type ATPase
LSETKQYIVGIDGGGSKTDAILVGMDGTVFAQATGGPSNLLFTGVSEAVTNVFDVILECAKKLNIDSSVVSNVVAGLAGAGRSVERTNFIEHLLSHSVKQKFPLKQVRVETDARIALEAAFASGPGIVVVAGTGSIVLYRTEDDKILRAGGWGRLIGDEGSGYMIARDALNAVFRQVDGRGEKTLLTQKALAHFGAASTDEILSKIYYDRADLPSFAPKVFEAAAERDRQSHLLLIKNAGDLSDQVRVLIMQVRPKKKLPVALMGGLLDSDNVYAKLVRDRILSSLPQVVVQRPKFPAAFGAAILGLNAFR